jgi:hypothetical protein
MLLPAQRREEVAGIRWSEINGDIWTIPAARAKNGQSASVCSIMPFRTVRGVYDRYAYLEEKRAALDALAQLIERIVDPTSNVVALKMQPRVLGQSADR